MGSAIVGLILLGLSLSHLTGGLEMRTKDGFWLSLLLALGIDASIVSTEAALVVAAVKGIHGVRGWAMAWLLISLATSSVLNALKLTTGMELWTISWGFNCFLGAFIPTGVFVLAKVGTALVVGDRKASIPLPEAGEELDLETLRLAGNLSRQGYRKRSRKPERV